VFTRLESRLDAQLLLSERRSYSLNQLHYSLHQVPWQRCKGIPTYRDCQKTIATVVHSNRNRPSLWVGVSVIAVSQFYQLFVKSTLFV